jgi:hypothetical protein
MRHHVFKQIDVCLNNHFMRLTATKTEQTDIQCGVSQPACSPSVALLTKHESMKMIL